MLTCQRCEEPLREGDNAMIVYRGRARIRSSFERPVPHEMSCLFAVCPRCLGREDNEGLSVEERELFAKLMEGVTVDGDEEGDGARADE
ncbi:MAG: hypothetical protein ACE5JM_10235 [Armatimonadota bacterium]